jgi:hypothetical protein
VLSLSGCYPNMMRNTVPVQVIHVMLGHRSRGYFGPMRQLSSSRASQNRSPNAGLLDSARVGSSADDTLFPFVAFRLGGSLRWGHEVRLTTLQSPNDIPRNPVEPDDRRWRLPYKALSNMFEYVKAPRSGSVGIVRLKDKACRFQG